MEYVDDNAEVILGLRAFATLPRRAALLVLSTEDLKASELSKFQAAHKWAKAFCDEEKHATLSEVSLFHPSVFLTLFLMHFHIEFFVKSSFLCNYCLILFVRYLCAHSPF